MSDFWFYFKIGLDHVLDYTAYDHVLFLIVLSVPYVFKDWRRVLLMVTLFTLGHTTSLLLAVYDVVRINRGLIEFLIPVTIFIAALYNVFTAGRGAHKDKLGVLLITALFFGLIHGLGFSGFFEQLTAHLSNKLLPLAEFALGIEAAQIIITLIVLIIGFICQTIFRFSRRDWMMFISAVVIGMVIPMLIANYPW
ncbi:MAG: HupE/UreJ family protein [Bacteroidota bacterium]|nr:HupE/UreJ family protein [Bacteroidota bacterium]MEC8885359.1 HupE/UreJ family protein [Bacteroidota bacterium]MEE3225423.1 HupE/UreJ family protein [Bacteroidota bacterium]MEE3243931.1 HupE/UreJ family protein [Bacteroidota bacterium]|tara:strand:+ start:361 stop:945 length:585 start_codon:yes stop_codon:yes gene_type:complete